MDCRYPGELKHFFPWNQGQLHLGGLQRAKLPIFEAYYAGDTLQEVDIVQISKSIEGKTGSKGADASGYDCLL